MSSGRKIELMSIRFRHEIAELVNKRSVKYFSQRKVSSSSKY